jgi:hypothetical protein
MSCYDLSAEEECRDSTEERERRAAEKRRDERSTSRRLHLPLPQSYSRPVEQRSLKEGGN